MAWCKTRRGLLVFACAWLVDVAVAGATTVTLATDRAAPQPVGTRIRWTASAAGGTAPYAYKWWISDGATWLVLRDWNPSATFDWTPSLANSSYRVGVWVRSAGNTADQDEVNLSLPFAIGPAMSSSVTAVQLQTDKASPQALGATVTWTAQPTGGRSPHSYKWWLWDGTTWRLLRDWGASATYAWTPTITSSAYRVGVWVRSAGATTDVDEANVSLPFTVNASVVAQVTAVGLRADKASPQAVGATVTWTAQPTGGTAPYSYKWWLSDGTTWRLLRDWGTSATYAWTPTSANAGYRVGVWVRSAGMTTDVDEANLSLPFVIGAAPSARVATVALQADRLTPQPVGGTITWTAQPVGGTAPLSYKWWLWDGTTWRVLRDWGSSATYAWTPTSSNAGYRVGVWVRSMGATSDVDEANVSQPFAITATVAARVSAVSLTADRTSPQPSGTTVVWTARATGGAGPLSYKWLVHDGLTWRAVTDWTQANEWAWTPTQPNEAFRIGVWAKSAGNTADQDEANVSQAFPIRGGVPDCLQSLEPAVVTIGSGGGAATARVTPTTAACAWTVTSQATWITVTSPTRVTGSGTVTLTAAPNVDQVSRTGYVMVGTRALSVTQGGVSTTSGCTYAVFPTTFDAGFGNETATVAVTAPPGCAWSASASGFAHVSPASGSGSGTVAVAIDNNTAQESRGVVLMVAGRAVTVTQAGRAANPQGCTYSVTPAEATFDFRAATASVRVSTQSGCAWTATESSGFVALTSASSGSGSATVTVRIDANPLSTPRSALVMIAGEPVTIEQGAASLTQPCAYRLSSTSASLAYAGGSGSVGVVTTGDCAWDVVSHTDWIHVTESSGPTGNGSVWFSVDANSGGARAGTLVIAGQAFTVSQSEPPSTGNPSEITWSSAEPDPSRVGQCEGNCGAGCGTFFNPCGGPHYWERIILSTPQYVGDDWEPVCSNGSSWFVVKPRYTALARWTYHGLKSTKCEQHDATCRALDLIPFLPADKALCLATAGLVGLNGLNYCEGAQPFDWSYEFLDFGHGAPVAYVDGPPCD